MLSAKAHPALVVFPEYGLPELLKNGGVQHGIAITGSRLIGFGADLGMLAEKYNFKSLSHTNTFKAGHFERFLAKWAYCIAIQNYGLDRFEEVYVIDDILEKKDTIGTFVGCDQEIIIGTKSTLSNFIIYEMITIR